MKVLSRVIVTGGCGFIGSHLVDKLIERGYEVIVIDNLSASENDMFYFNDKASYYEYDICDKDIITPLFEGVDYVFHLAAESRIQPAILNPLNAYNVNVIGTLNILEACKKFNIKRIMYSSTSSVYGLNCNFPTKENSELDCLNPYSHSKLLSEDLIRHYTKLEKFDSVIFRYFNVFGERSPVKGQYAPVVGIFLNQLKNKKSLTIVGDGKKFRDFVYVGDVCEANILAMCLNNNLNGEIINVGTGEMSSIKYIADNISNNQIHLSDRPGEAIHTMADISKLNEILNFHPKNNIIDWIQTQI